MSRYDIYLNAGASLAVHVEADDLESAVEAAYRQAPSGVCAQCSGWGRPYSIDIGEWELDEDGYAVDGEYVDGLNE